MRVEVKNVYYCDFCKRRRLMRSAMEKHELHCTMNPDRVCRWHLLDDMPSVHMASVASGDALVHRMRKGLPRWVRMVAPLDAVKVENLREHAKQCPACMLAALRQSGLNRAFELFDPYDCWQYEEEVERYREEEREHWRQEERREIEASFL